MKKFATILVMFVLTVTLYKGVSLPNFPSPFEDNTTISVFAVLSGNGVHARNGVITATFDLYASEAAHDAKKPKITSYSYTLDSINQTLTIDSMDGFFNMVYDVVIAGDPNFTGATVVTETEEE